LGQIPDQSLTGQRLGRLTGGIPGLVPLLLVATVLTGCGRPHPAAPVTPKMLATSGAAAVPAAGLRLWLCSAVGLAGSGPVARWADQSGYGNDAVQGESAHQPRFAPGQVNDLPAVHFDAKSDNALSLPPFMAGAAAGEAFVVVRRSPATNVVGLWAFGGASGSRYPESNGQINDDFASSTWRNTVPAPADLTNFHLYNVGGDGSVWFQNFDGVSHFRQEGNTVKFRDHPTLGDGNGCFFDGDIAEVIVYDRVLTDAERKLVTGYLTIRYSLGRK
jgi:hypothetical protein